MEALLLSLIAYFHPFDESSLYPRQDCSLPPVAHMYSEKIHKKNPWGRRYKIGFDETWKLPAFHLDGSKAKIWDNYCIPA